MWNLRTNPLSDSDVVEISQTFHFKVFCSDITEMASLVYTRHFFLSSLNLKFKYRIPLEGRINLLDK